MADKSLIVITDADAIIATVNENDANHKLAMRINEQLTEMKAIIITPVTAVMEAITALKRIVNRPDLSRVLVEQCQNGSIPTVGVESDMLTLAIPYFNPDSSKQDTFFDAVVAALAKKHHASAIFSFDEGYKKTEFPLIADFLQSQL